MYQPIMEELFRRALKAFENDDPSAEQMFQELAEMAERNGDREMYLLARRYALRARAIRLTPSASLQGFAELWNEVKDSSSPLRPYILGDYLVALAYEGRCNEADKLLEGYGWLMKDPTHRTATLATIRTLCEIRLG